VHGRSLRPGEKQGHENHAFLMKVGMKYMAYVNLGTGNNRLYFQDPCFSQPICNARNNATTLLFTTCQHRNAATFNF